MKDLWNDNEDIRSLKSLILFGLRGMVPMHIMQWYLVIQTKT